MKRTLWIVCMLIGTALFAQSTPLMGPLMGPPKGPPKGPQKGSGLEQAVLKLEQEWVEALTKADAAKLETFYADTLVYTHSDGRVDDKAKYIANFKTGATKYVSIERDDAKVNLYGDTAIVTCHAIIKLKTNGADRTVDARMIHVYSKIKGRWQMVAHQTTKLG